MPTRRDVLKGGGLLLLAAACGVPPEPVSPTEKQPQYPVDNLRTEGMSAPVYQEGVLSGEHIIDPRRLDVIKSTLRESGDAVFCHASTILDALMGPPGNRDMMGFPEFISTDNFPMRLALGPSQYAEVRYYPNFDQTGQGFKFVLPQKPGELLQGNYLASLKYGIKLPVPMDTSFGTGTEEQMNLALAVFLTKETLNIPINTAAALDNYDLTHGQTISYRNPQGEELSQREQQVLAGVSIYYNQLFDPRTQIWLIGDAFPIFCTALAHQHMLQVGRLPENPPQGLGAFMQAHTLMEQYGIKE